MSDLIFKAKVQEGNLVFNQGDYSRAIIQRAFEGKEVNITINEYREKRSNAQNNWYYGVAIPIIQQFILETQGEKYSKEDINQFHLNTVVRPAMEVKPIFNMPCTIFKIKRTSDMSKTEFMDFKDKIQQYWLEYDVYIPDPNETNWL